MVETPFSLPHVLGFIAIAEIGGMFVWVTINASVYTGRAWKSRDMFWVRRHGRDGVISAVIAAVLLFCAWKVLGH